MENTLENKAKFFAMYWGQMVVSTSTHKEQGLQHLKCLGGKHSVKDGVYLELKPLHYDFTPETFEYLLKKLTPENFDHLRSRGYALPWMGLSVEELVNRGWVKLKGEIK